MEKKKKFNNYVTITITDCYSPAEFKGGFDYYRIKISDLVVELNKLLEENPDVDLYYITDSDEFDCQYETEESDEDYEIRMKQLKMDKLMIEADCENYERNKLKELLDKYKSV